MHARWKRLLRFVMASTIILVPLGAQGSVFNVTIDSSGFSGSNAIFAFDFIDGGLPSNVVTLSSLSSDGTQGLTSVTGDVAGTGPWVFGDSSFFNELLVAFTPLGNFLTFSFVTTDNAPVGAVPDAFSLFILDPVTLLPLFGTSDPTQSNALLLFSINETGAGGLSVYMPDVAGFSIRVSTVSEPASLGLLLVGLVPLLAMRRSMLS